MVHYIYRLKGAHGKSRDPDIAQLKALGNAGKTSAQRRPLAALSTGFAR